MRRVGTSYPVGYDGGSMHYFCRRDLAALQTAGFPIYDDIVNGTPYFDTLRLATNTLVFDDGAFGNVRRIQEERQEVRRAERELTGLLGRTPSRRSARPSRARRAGPVRGLRRPANPGLRHGRSRAA